MDKIKFRYFWNKVMYYIDFTKDNLKIGFSAFERRPKTSQLMQYTGLRDKNGKEIYEKDIIKHDNGKNYEVKLGYFEESVNGGEYSNTCYGWYIGGKEEFEDYNQIHNSIYIKLIGNIYENPESLRR